MRNHVLVTGEVPKVRAVILSGFISERDPKRRLFDALEKPGKVLPLIVLANFKLDDLSGFGFHLDYSFVYFKICSAEIENLSNTAHS